MKIRTGFVSNSSSSSFILAWKGDLLTALKKAFHISQENYPIKDLTFIAETFIEYLDDEKFVNGMTKKDIKDWYNDEPNELIDYMEQGYKVAVGSFPDNEGALTDLLCQTDFDYDTEELKITQSGGY